VDLESVADELYAASPDDFVERRTQRVAEARGAKDRALVKAIGQLRRPTRSAWLVNLLARAEPAEVEALLDLGSELAEAQRRAAGADLRRLSAQRHAALEALTRRATGIAADHGHAATEATRQEVTQTLQAALSDPAVAAEVRAGRVVQPASYGGFGPLDLLTALAPPTPAAPDGAAPDAPAEPEHVAPAEPGPVPDAAPQPPPSTAPKPRAAAPEAEPGPDPARVAAETAVREAEEALAHARSDADEAEEVAESATAHADDLAEQVESLRGQLAEAEEAERRARDQARTARKQFAQQRQDRTRAEESLAEARAALTALGPE
jgi:hypothetical protein